MGVRSQFVLALSMIAGMTVIRATGAAGPWRHIFLAMGTAVVIRYFFWRTVNTLPPISDPWNFVPGVLPMSIPPSMLNAGAT